jgi:hypothetical protein
VPTNYTVSHRLPHGASAQPGQQSLRFGQRAALVSTKGICNSIRNGRRLNGPETSSRSKCNPRQETLRECRHASRSGRAIGETGSARQSSARPPNAIGQVRCHARCSASLAMTQCRGNVGLAGLSQRHNRDHLRHDQADDVDALALLATVEWHQQAPVLADNHYGSPR